MIMEAILKKISKDVVAIFKVLLDHSTRDYEPSPTHVLKRMVRPLCRELELVMQKGTKNEAWDILEGFSKTCKTMKI